MQKKWISKKLWNSLRERRGLRISIPVILIVGIATSSMVFGSPFFNIFNIAILVSIFLAIKRQGMISGFLFFLVMDLVAFYDPPFFESLGQQGTAAFRGAALLAWSGFVLLGVGFVTSLHERQTVAATANHAVVLPQKPRPPYDLLLNTVTHITHLGRYVKQLLPPPPRNVPRSPFGN